MKKILLTISLMIVTLNAISQNRINIVLPESYELSNIILALTDYGRTDEWEVLKSTDYYREVITFFGHVKNHPLLDSVNYSREKWEDYLSFRTDAFAFHFDKTGKLKRKFDFFSVEGHASFDKYLDLIDDFVEKSNFRIFYKQHKEYYDFITKNYKDYYLIDKSFEFLNHFIGKRHSKIDNFQYFIVLSPLVCRMNCHREISNKMIVDFPSATPDFLNETITADLSTRLNGNHMIFTEIDHGFVNSVSEQYQNRILDQFDVNKWDLQSGYPGINSFNEYMTWAVWDIFAKKYFPEDADFLITQWQYQNASRGFFAQNLFSDKLVELTNNGSGQKLENLYPPLLEWCEKANDLSIPKIINCSNIVNNETKEIAITIHFSEPMKPLDSFETIMSVMENGFEIGINKNIEIKDAKWTNGGKTVTFSIQSEYKNFLLVFNWWGIGKPLISKNGIFLQNKSYMIIKEQQEQISDKRPIYKNIIFITFATLLLGIIAICSYLFLKK